MQPMVRIVSYNVHACVGSDGKFDPDRILDVLEILGADFVALQEFEDRRYASGTLSEYFADRLGMFAYSGSTLRRKDAPYGNLLFAGREASRIRTHDLSEPGGEPRGAIEAAFDLGDNRLQLVATHLGLRATERRRQVIRLLEIVSAIESDIAVLAGDVNEWRPRAFALRTLARTFEFGSRSRTFPARSPVLALDRIYVSPGTRVVDHYVDRSQQSRQASDHLPLVCDLSVAGSDGHGSKPCGP
jgi:endonuclease/exonuclease/phosphatase family metal-dependent hydrolase